MRRTYRTLNCCEMQCNAEVGLFTIPAGFTIQGYSNYRAEFAGRRRTWCSAEPEKYFPLLEDQSLCLLKAPGLFDDYLFTETFKPLNTERGTREYLRLDNGNFNHHNDSFLHA